MWNAKPSISERRAMAEYATRQVLTHLHQGVVLQGDLVDRLVMAVLGCADPNDGFQTASVMAVKRVHNALTGSVISQTQADYISELAQSRVRPKPDDTNLLAHER